MTRRRTGRLVSLATAALVAIGVVAAIPAAGSAPAPAAAVVAPTAADEESNQALTADPSAEYTAPWNSLGALNNGSGVTEGGDHGAVWGTYSDVRPATRWAQYTWENPVTVDRTSIMFWHDKERGTGDNVAVPIGWSLQYWSPVTQDWADVQNPTGFPTVGTGYDEASFTPVTTTRLRVTLQASPNADGTAFAAVAMSEWQVWGTAGEVTEPDPSDPLSIEDVNIPTTVGVAPVLPGTVRVVLAEGTTERRDVVWDMPTAQQLAEVGGVTVSGTAVGVTGSVTATVWVRATGSDGGGIVDVVPGSALTTVGVAPDLPPTVDAVYADGSMDSRVAVTWPQIDPAQYAAEGFFDLEGAVAGATVTALLTVVVDSAAPAPGEDTVAPVVRAATDPELPPTGWFIGEVTVTVSARDAVDSAPRIETRLDEGAWTATTGTRTVSDDGNHVLQVRATDAAGNVSSVRSVSLPIDSAPPATRAALAESPTSATVTLTAEDAVSGIATVQYRLGDGFEASYTAPFPVTRKAAAQTVTYWSTDKAGNRSADRTLTIGAVQASDVTAPKVALVLVPAAPDGTSSWYTRRVVATVTATDDRDPNPVRQVSVNGSAWRTVTGATVSTSSDGVTRISVRACDAVRNCSAARTVSVKVDGTDPRTVATWSAGPRTLVLRSSDATSGVLRTQYRLGTGGWRTYTGTLLLPASATKMSYRAVDRAGNVSGGGSVSVPARRPVATTLTTTVTGSPAKPGRAVGIEVLARAIGSVPAPTGTITVWENSRRLATGTLTRARVVVRVVPGAVVGRHVLTVRYSGDRLHAASGRTVTVVVGR